jgi:hypothetical protein
LIIITCLPSRGGLVEGKPHMGAEAAILPVKVAGYLVGGGEEEGYI